MIAAALLVACSDDDAPAAADGGPPGNPPRVAGTVLVTPEQVAAASQNGLLARLASFLSGPAQAQLPGLVPLSNAQVQLFRADESAGLIEPSLRSTSTNESGEYAFDDLPGEGLLIVRAAAGSADLRAFVSGARVDITPASELTVRRVGAALDEDTPLSHFSRPELAALNGYLQGLLSLDAAGMDLEQVIAALDTRAGPLFSGLVAAYAEPDMETSLRAGSYGAVEFSAALRDPAPLADEGFAGGIDAASGTGVMIFGAEADAPDPAFVPRGLYLQEFDAAPRDASAERQDLWPGDDLSGLLHVLGMNGQLVVSDAARTDGASEVGLGAATAGGALMVYPLILGRDRDGAVAASGAGLRFAARWSEPVSSETITLLDPLGGGATLYHVMGLYRKFRGGADSPSVTAGSATGTLSFDSAAQSRTFPGDAEAREYGSFSTLVGRNAVTLALDDYVADGGEPGTALRNGLYYVVPGTGLMELRHADEDGTRFGSGALSPDGEIVAMQTELVEPDGTLERAFAVAIRQSSGETPPLTGVYNVVQYTAYLRSDGEEPPQTAFLAHGLRQGTLRLSGEDGLIDEGLLFSRGAGLDAAAARAGETASLAASTAVESLSTTGSFTAGDNGAVSLEILIEREGGSVETVVGTGAASAAGDFVALAIRSEGAESGPGRGMMFLLRQP